MAKLETITSHPSILTFENEIYRLREAVDALRLIAVGCLQDGVTEEVGNALNLLHDAMRPALSPMLKAIGYESEERAS